MILVWVWLTSCSIMASHFPSHDLISSLCMKNTVLHANATFPHLVGNSVLNICNYEHGVSRAPISQTHGSGRIFPKWDSEARQWLILASTMYSESLNHDFLLQDDDNHKQLCPRDRLWRLDNLPPPCPAVFQAAGVSSGHTAHLPFQMCVLYACPESVFSSFPCHYS